MPTTKPQTKSKTIVFRRDFKMSLALAILLAYQTNLLHDDRRFRDGKDHRKSLDRLHSTSARIEGSIARSQGADKLICETMRGGWRAQVRGVGDGDNGAIDG